MRRFIGFLSLMAAFCLLSGAAAESVVLRTVSCYAGGNSAGDAYVAILREFENETGYTVLDESTASNEAWKSGVLKRFAAGDEPDVLFFFAAGADSALLLNRLVPLAEISEAYPELSLPEEPALKEADATEFISTNTKDTVRFTKPRRTE